jgi:hypothetical protein
VTHYRNLFDAGKYLGAWHLPSGKDSIVEIESVTGGVLEAGTVKTRKPLVKMRGKGLILALNKTNAKTIARLYGPDVDQWRGKLIALYVGVTRDPSTGDNNCPCIRVRPSKPTGSGGGQIDESASRPAEDESE